MALSPGQALYQENCAACHGDEALGNGPMASSLPVPPPALKEHLGHHSQAQLVSLIQGGVPPAMPPQPLSAEEIQMVVDYLWTLVPADEVEALRAMQQHMESMGGSGMGGMPGMEMPGMEMPGMGAPADTAGGAMPMGADSMEHH